jgi:hypothetical protein
VLARLPPPPWGLWIGFNIALRPLASVQYAPGMASLRATDRAVGYHPFAL